MSKITRRIRRNCRILAAGERQMKDIYRIIFDHGDRIMTESATMTRKVRRSYRACEDEVETVARGIRASLGVTDRFIGLCGENSPRWMIAFWAILKSGNKPYLCNLRQPRAFCAGNLRTLEAVAVIGCGSEGDYGLPTLSYDRLVEEGREASPVGEVPFGDAFALSTNGTTLKEKICIYNGRQISEQILNIRSIIKENPLIVRPYRGQVKQLAFLPLYHIFGLEAMYLWYAFFGTTFVFPPDLSPQSLLRTVRNHDVTHLFAVPLLWHAVERSVLQSMEGQDDKTKRRFERGLVLSRRLQALSPTVGTYVAKKLFVEVRAHLFGDSVRFCISGGSYVKESALTLLNSLGYHLANGYGMTEVGITSVSLAKRPKERIGGSIGHPFDSVEYRVDEAGQLLIRGSSLCGHMLIEGQPADMDGWFATGDVARVDKKGYYLDGRVSDIVFGEDGENLNPDFAEKAFLLPQALGLSVLGDERNERLILVVRLPRDLLETQREHLLAEIEKCDATLPAAYRVREVRYTYDPIMDEGAIKVSRAWLRAAMTAGKLRFVPLMGETETPNEALGEESEIKRILRELFAEILRMPPEEVSDTGHFLNDLGGTSLDYFTLISEINERFGVTLSFEEDHFHYTLNDFEAILKKWVT